MDIANNLLKEEEPSQFQQLEKDHRETLRFITCGSVDDGKSTLIGRLLYDTDSLNKQDLASIQMKSGASENEELDFARLLDGLRDEQDQGITIDVGYRYFCSSNRYFIMADCPGHEQYTPNMATGASTADCGVILVDARKGVITQTKRHAYILHLLGVKEIILCINKMDLVNYGQETFDKIVKDFHALGFLGKDISVHSVPVSALKGDNVVQKGYENMPWYTGNSVLEYLESVEIPRKGEEKLLLPVQLMKKCAEGKRHYMGTVSKGTVCLGQTIKVLPSEQTTKVTSIANFYNQYSEAQQGRSIALTLENEIDISRGDFIVASDYPKSVSDQFQVDIICFSQEGLFSSRVYDFKFHHKVCAGTITKVKHKIDMDTLSKIPGEKLDFNEIGVCNISTMVDVPFSAYQDDRETGTFLIIDRFTKQTIGVGLIKFSLYRANNITPYSLSVSSEERSNLKNQKPCAILFTGLSAAGKSTISNQVEVRLNQAGFHTYLLDGDNLRKGLCTDLGFKDEDRIENMRRIAEVTKLFVDAGIIVLVAAIAPFKNERQFIRNKLPENSYKEIYVKASLETCEARDPKGLYKHFRQQGVTNFTGFGSTYEVPESPDLTLDTEQNEVNYLVAEVVSLIKKHQQVGN